MSTSTIVDVLAAPESFLPSCYFPLLPYLPENMALYAILAFVCQICLVFGVENDKYVVKERHKAPPLWKEIGPAPEHHTFLLRIGLTQRDFPELERQLYEVSDPSHARYGQYLSQAAIHKLVTPHYDTLQAVEDWLADFDLKWEYNTAKTWISVPISVLDAELLLDTTYSIWQHDDGTELIRTQSWSLPASLHPHITTIQPTNSWVRMKRNIPMPANGRRSSDALLAADVLPDIPLPPDSTISGVCNFSSVIPNCLRTLYGTASYTTKSDGASQLGICNYLGETNNRSDTYLFLEKYRPEAAEAAETFTQISVADGDIYNGSNTADAGTGLEGNLDAEYILGMAYPLPLTTWGTGGSPPDFMPSLSTPTDTDEPYLTWTNYILNQSTIPQMITTSYGDDEQTISYSYAQAVCNEFAQITARGVTLLFSSGDAGVGADGTCYSNVDNTTYKFLPSFPASCPFVTTVGATKNYPEVATNLTLRSGAFFTSGSGFSNYFGAPNYQKDFVDRYVANLNGLNDGFYNKSGQ